MAFLGSWKIGCYCPDFLFSFFLSLQALAGAEVGENYTQRPNRSLPSEASQMHLSELNTYELCTGVGDGSTVTGAGGGGGGAERDTQVWMRRQIRARGCKRRRAHTGKGGSNAHTHACSSIKSKCY